jgi:predicted transcriptional regulator
MSDASNLIELTAGIVSAHVSNNNVSLNDVPGLVQGVYGALSALGVEAAPAPEAKIPAVAVRNSVKADSITCLECGKKQKVLRRHLLTAHGLTPEQYRRAYGLPASYPMVASEYSERRAEMAKSIGLGRRGRPAAETQESAPAKAPARRGRKAKAES